MSERIINKTAEYIAAVNNAYNAEHPNPNYAEIKVKIDTGSSSSPFSIIWWILGLIVIVAIIWYLKKKK